MRRAAVRGVIPVAILVVILLAAPSASADIVEGVEYVVAGVLEVPRATLVGTFTGFPILGTAMGFMGGAVRGIGMVTKGALELVGAAIPIAARLAPLIPVFL